ncbi:efflux RND transporter periplasmic adaptor subunit [Pelobium sp.]|nr:efflux RND transporter periplasmic adaptor subunit [Pelobium sp.]
MKKLWKYNFLVLLLILTACQQKKTTSEHEHKQQYTCSMHPQVIKDEPGQCPICGMDLVPIQTQNIKVAVDADLSDLLQPANEAVISNIKTFKVSQTAQSDTLSLNGKVTYNSNNLKRVASRLSGRIEKLYVKYNFQMVSKGQKIMEIYSPDLAAAQQELLYLKNNDNNNLLEQAKNKLRLLGVSDQQINEVLRSGKVNYKVAVYSPVSGYIIDNQKTESAAPVTSTAMEASSALNTRTSNLALTEGAYVNIGDVLFRLFEPSNVWAEFYIPAKEAERITTKDKLNISSAKQEKTTAKIDLIQPYFNEGQNYKVARVYLNNTKQQFKIGELLKGELITKEISGLWIPAKAVYQLGQKSVVFVKQANVIKPKEVIIAQKGNQQFLIKSGLTAGDEIAENASFLIDTESFIKTTE